MTIENRDTGESRDLTGFSQGLMVVPNISPGTYKIQSVVLSPACRQPKWLLGTGYGVGAGSIGSVFIRMEGGSVSFTNPMSCSAFFRRYKADSWRGRKCDLGE